MQPRCTGCRLTFVWTRSQPPSSLLSLPRLNFSLSSFSFSLSLGLFFRGYKHARALMLQNGCMWARVYAWCTHPEGYARFMRVRATTLVHAVKFISVECTYTFLRVGKILLCLRSVSWTTWVLGRYSLTFSLSLFLSSFLDDLFADSFRSSFSVSSFMHLIW